MKHTIIPAVALILEQDGKIFVGRRQNTGYHDGKFNLPAGHIDPDETPKEALIRECQEEIGIELSEAELELVHVQYNRNLNKEHDRTHYYFRTVNPNHTPTNTEQEKCSEVLWLPVGERLDEFMPFMRGALTAIGEGEHYSEFFDES